MKRTIGDAGELEVFKDGDGVTVHFWDRHMMTISPDEALRLAVALIRVAVE